MRSSGRSGHRSTDPGALVRRRRTATPTGCPTTGCRLETAMSAPQPSVIGIIGGSGIYDIPGLENVTWERVHSPFGAPSDQVMTAELLGQKVVFLPRHGRGHRRPPTELNYRANI